MDGPQRIGSAIAPGTERAICLQTEARSGLVCLPAEICVDGGWRPIGASEAVVSFVALKVGASLRGSPSVVFVEFAR